MHNDTTRAMLEEGFAAAFLAVGAQEGRRTYIPAGDAAMDAARGVRRLGVTDPVIVYRRTRDRMPARETELREAIEDGITVRWLSTITDVENESITVERMRPDDSGFPQPTGEFEELAADTVVLVLGQDVDSGLLDAVPGIHRQRAVVQVGEDFRVCDDSVDGGPGIFAGGDMVPAEWTVIAAIGHGRLAAEHIDAYLRGERFVPPSPPPVATFDKLNTEYYSDEPATVRPIQGRDG